LSSSDPVWLAEADVARLIALPDAIAVVERALAGEAAGNARTMAKTYAAWGGGTLHALGGAIEERVGRSPDQRRGIAGVKTWVHAESAEPLLLLWDVATGRLRGIVEAFVLGQLRTASVSAIATRWLAREDADTMAIIGTGKQALAQVAAVAAVRPLRSVRVFSPTAAHRSAFVARLSGEGFGFAIEEATSVAEAVDGARVVTTATRARAPFLARSMLARGAHVNAIGAITPERSELAADVAPAADRVVADHPDDARRVSAELEGCRSIAALGAVVASRTVRPRSEELTVFKAVGLGLADVAIAAEVLDRAAAHGLGQSLRPAVRATPRWRDAP
jgi:ornithine cyclodeaminase